MVSLKCSIDRWWPSTEYDSSELQMEGNSIKLYTGNDGGEL